MSNNYNRVKKLVEKSGKKSSGTLLNSLDRRDKIISKVNISNNLKRNMTLNLSLSPSEISQSYKVPLGAQAQTDPETFLQQNYGLRQRTKIKQTFTYWKSLKLLTPQKPKTINASYKAIDKMLRIVDGNVKSLQQIIKSYAEVLQAPESFFTKGKPYRVSPAEFLKWDSFGQMMVEGNKVLKNETCLFNAFRLRTPEEACADFFRMPPDVHPEISKVIREVWKSSGKVQVSKVNAQNHSRKIANRFMKFWKTNKHKISKTGYTARDKKKPEIMLRKTLTKFLEDQPTDFKFYYLNSDVFFNKRYPKFLLERHTMTTEDEAQYIVKQARERRKPRRASKVKISSQPDWMRRKR